MATQTQTTFKPLGNRVVVKPGDADEQMTSGGIYIPDTAKEKPQEGEVPLRLGRVGSPMTEVACRWNSQ